MADVSDRLLRAAAEVFAERGYDGAGVAEIARRAGLTTGAIYSRYTGKAELLLAAVDAAMPDDIRGILRDGGETHESSPDIIARLGTRLLDEGRSQKILLEAVATARRDPDMAERVRARFADERRRLAKLVDEGKAAGLVDEALDTHAIVTLCQAVGLGFLLLEPAGHPLPSHEAWDTLIARLVAAASPSAATAPTSRTSGTPEGA